MLLQTDCLMQLQTVKDPRILTCNKTACLA